MKRILSILINHLWLLLFLAGGIGALFVIFVFSNDRESFSLLQYAVYIAIFIIIVIGIGLFPNKHRWEYFFLLLPFIFFLGVICPKMNFYALCNHIEEYYTYENVFLYPLLILSVCFAYRIGGGKSGLCIKTGISGIILIFSGFLDLMWHLINGLEYKEIMDITVRQIYNNTANSPDLLVRQKLTIPHIELILGYLPDLGGLLLFISAHLVLMFILNLLPLDKWIDRLKVSRKID